MAKKDLAAEFCRSWAHAPGIQVIVWRSSSSPLLAGDVGEFRDGDWGDSRPDGVSEFVAGRPARLTALRETGHVLGCDHGVEYLATLDVYCEDP